METKIEKLKESRIQATTIITPEERSLAEQKALKSLATRVKIKGFREGMAPADLVRSHVKPEDVTEETIRMILPDVVSQSLKESGAKPIIRPSANVVSLEPLTISITFVERPIAEIKKPDSIKVEKKVIAETTDKEADAFIHKLLKQDMTEMPVEREAKKGDAVKVSLAAKDKAGKQIDEITVGHYSVHIGEEELLKELESHVLGMKKGDKKNVEIEFAKDHDIPAIKGKKVSIEITAKEIAEVKLPELTAAYIKTRLGAERTPEAFKTEVKQMLSSQNKSTEMKRRENELYDKVKAATKIEIAPELIDAEVQEMLADLQQRLKKQEMTIEQWLESTNKKAEEVMTEMKGIAKDRIILRFGMQALADAKKTEADPKRIEESITRERAHAKEHGHSVKEEDLKEGGQVYEQIRWEQKMQQLVGEMIEEEKKAG